MGLTALDLCRNGDVFVARFRFEGFIVRTRFVDFSHRESSEAVGAYFCGFGVKQLLVYAVIQMQYVFLAQYNFPFCPFQLLMVVRDCPGDQLIEQLVFSLVQGQLVSFRKSKRHLSGKIELLRLSAGLFPCN